MQPLITTGISGLDSAIGDEMVPGKLIGAVGFTGSGKTILATHFIRGAIRAGVPFFYLSTETDSRELFMRAASAELGIPYIDLCRPSGNVAVDSDSNIFLSEALSQHGVNSRLAEFQSRCRSLGTVTCYDPTKMSNPLELNLIDVEINAFEDGLRDRAGVLVYDYVTATSLIEHPETRGVHMLDIMQKLRERCNRGNFMALALAQASNRFAGTRYVHKNHIAESTELMDEVDAFIGIGQEVGTDGIKNPNGSTPVYRRNQALNVVTRRATVQVPVVTAFEFQRFEDRPARDTRTGPFVPFTRSRYLDLCALPVQNALNVFLLLVLFSRYNNTDSNLGMCWPSQNLIVEMTGLSLKQVRTAINELVEKRFVEKTSVANRNNRYTILDWRKHHDVLAAC